MGSRGPAPTPTAMLSARGSPRAKRRQNEPAYAAASAQCPTGLCPRARAEWKRVVPSLITGGVLTVADRAMLTAYCQAWGEWSRAAELVAKIDAGKHEHKGKAIDHPRRVLASAFDRMNRAAQQFGLTPASRSRVDVKPSGSSKHEKPVETPTLKIA